MHSFLSECPRASRLMSSVEVNPWQDLWPHFSFLAGLTPLAPAKIFLGRVASKINALALNSNLPATNFLNCNSSSRSSMLEVGSGISPIFSLSTSRDKLSAEINFHVTSISVWCQPTFHQPVRRSPFDVSWFTSPPCDPLINLPRRPFDPSEPQISHIH